MHALYTGLLISLTVSTPALEQRLGSHCCVTCVTREREGAMWGARCRGWGVWGQQETQYAIFLHL